MARPHAITDHTTAIRHKSWAGRADGRSNANPMVEIDTITVTERRVLVAFKQALADYQTHKLSTLMLQSDIKALLAEVKLPHTKVRHILKNAPSEIAFFTDPKSGNSYVVLKRAIVTNNDKEASTSGSAVAHSRQGSTSTSNARQDSRQLSASVPASSSGRPSAGPSTSTSTANASASASTSRQSAQPAPLFADDSDTTSAEEEEDDKTDSDASNSRRRKASRSAKQKEKDSHTRRHSESTWGMQRPKEQQMHTREVANATTSPQKRDRFAHPGPRKSAPVAAGTSSSRSVSAPQGETGKRSRDAMDESDEEDLLSAIRESQSVAPQEESRSLAGGREGEEPLVIPVRKQPAPPSVTALRETAAGHGLDSHGDGSFWTDNGGGHADMSLDNNLGNDTLIPSFFQNADSQDQYGEEIPLDGIQSQAGPSRQALNGEEDEEDDFDLDMDTRRRSTSRSHHRTSSGGGSARKEVPDLLFDGYKATRSRGRSVRPGPPGMDEASTRDSSVQEAESLEDQDLEDEKELKPVPTKRGPTKPGTVHRRSSDSSDSDTVLVTSKRAGAPPSKTREEREAERQQRQRDRQEREARKEARLKEKEALSKKKKKNPLPNFRNTQGQEAAELKAAYRTYLADLKRRKAGLEHGITAMPEVIDLDADETVDPLPEIVQMAEENASWTQVFSYESHKTKANRPDYNSVKFWSYKMPFPGRRRDEAIVAMAGGCVVRVFRLSEKRGITELWNVVDESVGWEKEELREVFYSCAWTHDVRREAGIAPHWRKWPILCVAGAGREVKILDGYSGALLKVIQGHGGPIYSLAVHPSLPHVIATASGDEAISLWDISVPVSKPETAAGHGMLEELDKRRKGHTEGERLCVFGGYAGHVEAVLSISIHPSLPLLVSGGGDCKLRIWRIPDNLPPGPSSSLTCPTPIDPPEKSTRPSAFAFPIFTQTSLHSHHIDHVEWVGHKGHILTRSLCYDAPGKRVIRLFRPKFFDIYQNSLAKPPDVVGFEIDFGPQVELIARWTAPSCSGGIGDGVMCTATELVKEEDGKLSTRRRIYVPSIEPAMHIYDLDLRTKQPDLKELLQKYPFKLGQEILFEEDKRKNSVLKAADCQTAGRGWLVAVGESEKITIWKRKGDPKWSDTKAAVTDLLRSLRLAEHRDDSSEMDEERSVTGDVPNGDGHVHATTPEEDDLSQRGAQPRLEVDQGASTPPLLTNGLHTNGSSHLPSAPPEDAILAEAEDASYEPQQQRNGIEGSFFPEPASSGVLINGQSATNGEVEMALPGVDNELNGMHVDDQQFSRSPSVEYV